MILSIDGVPEDKRGTKSIQVYSVQFPPCRSVYAIRVAKYAGKENWDPQIALDELVDDLNANGELNGKAVAKAFAKASTEHIAYIVTFPPFQMSQSSSWWPTLR